VCLACHLHASWLQRAETGIALIQKEISPAQLNTIAVNGLYCLQSRQIIFEMGSSHALYPGVRNLCKVIRTHLKNVD
jgi:hypothetical protein